MRFFVALFVLPKEQEVNTMKTQRYGLELEFTGIKRGTAANSIANVLGAQAQYVGGGYSAYEIKAADGRKWKVMYDSSIRAESGADSTMNSEYKCEFVTPICTYADIETIQEIVRAIRRAGGKVNESCGIHVHIDASGHTAKSLRNLANIMASKETLLFKALEVNPARYDRWCKKVDDNMLTKLDSRKPKTLEEVKRIWYNGDTSRCYQHYDNSRYHALNLHAVWQKGTVEFRMFNSTLHAGKVKSYIQLCLAISAQAKRQKGACRKETVSTNPKYTFRTWLIRLGLNGDEYKTARLHLLANLEGDIAFHDGRRAA
jgi:hypothetical protein